MAKKNGSTAPAPLEVPFIGANQDNAEAKPKRTRAAKIKAAPPAPELTITADEVRLLAAYSAMDNRAKHDTVAFAHALAKVRPAIAVPVLRLVVGGAK